MKVTQVASDQRQHTTWCDGGVGGGNELPSVSSMLQTILYPSTKMISRHFPP